MFEAAELEQSTTREELDDALEPLRVDLLNAQFDLQHAPFSLVVQLGGNDWPFQGLVMKSLHEWMDQRHIDTVALGRPSQEERRRPRLWRYWRRLPARGQTAVFADGWSTHLLLESAEGRVSEEQLELRIRHIIQFEQALTANGVLLLKYWFHLDKKALKKRLKQASRHSERAWWVSETNEHVYNVYDAGVPFAERIVRTTSTGSATWNIIGSRNPEYALLTLARDLHDRLTTRLAETPAHEPVPPIPRVEVPRGRTVLDTVDLERKTSKTDYDKQLRKLHGRIGEVSQRAFEAGLSVVGVFEGWDAAGKGGAIRRLTWPMDVTHFRVIAVGAPTDEELARHYLWRFWRHLPAPGRMTIFDRSWYGRVLVERVEGLAAEETWRRAYTEINDLEGQLTESGAVVLKFWLHIDREEQLARFEAREKTPYKKYKITGEDYRNREKWDAYLAAVDDMVEQTDTPDARWHLVSANDKRSARLEVLATYLETVEARLPA